MHRYCCSGLCLHYSLVATKRAAPMPIKSLCECSEGPEKLRGRGRLREPIRSDGGGHREDRSPGGPSRVAWAIGGSSPLPCPPILSSAHPFRSRGCFKEVAWGDQVLLRPRGRRLKLVPRSIETVSVRQVSAKVYCSCNSRRPARCVLWLLKAAPAHLSGCRCSSRAHRGWFLILPRELLRLGTVLYVFIILNFLFPFSWEKNGDNRSFLPV